MPIRNRINLFHAEHYRANAFQPIILLLDIIGHRSQIRYCGPCGCPQAISRTSHVLRARTPQARLLEAAYPRHSFGSRNLGQSSDSLANHYSSCR
ncbi:UNVERIFIED_CONTAM: hypothetical protein Sradi_5836300 [Sesamum radiatum]|uniref:Uncharacterized protein n=1 Tax=Sesamum radiatum TaxID=300843 RepID=A0AAW2KPF9_SESRA